MLKDDNPLSLTASAANGSSSEDADLEDLYTRYKRLHQQLEFLYVQEEYIKDEQRNLKKEYLHAQEEVNEARSHSPALVLS